MPGGLKAMPQIEELKIFEANLDYNFVYTYLHHFNPIDIKVFFCPS
jgi:hypothetical protein